MLMPGLIDMPWRAMTVQATLAGAAVGKLAVVEEGARWPICCWSMATRWRISN